MKRGIYSCFEGPNGSGKSTQVKKFFHHLKTSNLSAILNTQPTKKSASESVGDFQGTGTNPFGVIIRELIESRMPSDEMIGKYLLKLKELKKIILSDNFQAKSEKDKVIRAEFISRLYGVHDFMIQGVALDEKAMQALYCADGFFDFKETVIPTVENGVFVVQDRERFTSFAHGNAGGFPFLENLYIHQAVLGDFYIKPDVLFYIDTPASVCVEHLAKSGKVLDIYEKEDSIGRIIQSYKEAISFFKTHPEVGYKHIYVVDGEQSEDAVFEEIVMFWNVFLSQHI